MNFLERIREIILFLPWKVAWVLQLSFQKAECKSNSWNLDSKEIKALTDSSYISFFSPSKPDTDWKQLTAWHLESNHEEKENNLCTVDPSFLLKEDGGSLHSWFQLMLLWWLWLERYCLWAVKMLASPYYLDINDLYAWNYCLQLSCFLCFSKGPKTAILQLTNPVNIFQTEVVWWAGDFILVYTSASFGIYPKANINACILNEECRAFISVVWHNFETANFLGV